jgi:hypothetical protein
MLCLSVCLKIGLTHKCTRTSTDANADPATVEYPNEFRVEAFYPPYLMTRALRPSIMGPFLGRWRYGQRVTINAYIPSGNVLTVGVALFTNGFVTHSTHQGQRYVRLDASVSLVGTPGQNRYRITVGVPPSPTIVPPGWYMLFVLDGRIPAVASWVRVGGDPAGIGMWV